MRRYFAVQVSFELKWELHEYFRVVCCDFCYSGLSHGSGAESSRDFGVDGEPRSRW